jgi:hypothetical protein
VAFNRYPWAYVTTPKGESILSGFLEVKNEIKLKCLFNGCDRTFDRTDRALGHIRLHLEHRPFIWSMRIRDMVSYYAPFTLHQSLIDRSSHSKYSTRASLHSHAKNRNTRYDCGVWFVFFFVFLGFIDGCFHSGTRILSQNMARHVRRCHLRPEES